MGNYEMATNLFNSGVRRRKDSNVYIAPDGTEIRKTVTDVVRENFPFDVETVARRSTEGMSPKYPHLHWTELAEKWKATGKFGQVVHHQIAEYIRNKKEPTEKSAILAKDWHDQHKAKFKQLTKSFPEIIVYNIKIGIAGRVDLLVTATHGNGGLLVDWTTSKNYQLEENALKLKMSIHSYLMNLHRIFVRNHFVAILKEDSISWKKIEVDYESVRKIFKIKSSST